MGVHPNGCWVSVGTLVPRYSMGLYRLAFKQMSQGSKEGFLLSTVLRRWESHQRQRLILTDG